MSQQMEQQQTEGGGTGNEQVLLQIGSKFLLDFFGYSSWIRGNRYDGDLLQIKTEVRC